jgi:hypothetical protein
MYSYTDHKCLTHIKIQRTVQHPLHLRKKKLQTLTNISPPFFVLFGSIGFRERNMAQMQLYIDKKFVQGHYHKITLHLPSSARDLTNQNVQKSIHH